MDGSSERIAQEFMSQGRPAGDGLQASGSRPGDVAVGIEILTPQPGKGFKEWALGGFDKEGKAAGKVGDANYDKTPGASADVKANIPQIVTSNKG